MFYQQLISEVQQFLVCRLEHYFSQREDAPAIDECKIPEKRNHPFSGFIDSHKLSQTEQLMLALALVPHLNPELFAKAIQHFLLQGGNLPIFGGAKGQNHRGIIPTGETVQFILAGTDMEKRLEVAKLLKHSTLTEQGILELEMVPSGEPAMSGKLTVTKEYVDLFLTGEKSIPTFGPDFPAQKIETERSWDNLVLSKEVQEQIEELKMWIEHNDRLMQNWQMHKKLKPGYRVLFYGPSGTGKTMTATLLGKYTDHEVFRVDLSTIVSKYIGETEKNLEKLFSKAAHKDWILFFDEADALFGKRTDVGDAHDRYANQEVSYLLQRVEHFGGLVILSTNYKSNIDDAFLRRFNAIIKFPFPDARQRERMWKKSLPEKARLGSRLDLAEIAGRFELTGGNIINAVHVAALQAVSDDFKTIALENVLHGIRREVEKEGKIFEPLPEKHITTNGTP